MINCVNRECLLLIICFGYWCVFLDEFETNREATDQGADGIRRHIDMEAIVLGNISKGHIDMGFRPYRYD